MWEGWETYMPACAKKRNCMRKSHWVQFHYILCYGWAGLRRRSEKFPGFSGLAFDICYIEQPIIPQTYRTRRIPRAL